VPHNPKPLDRVYKHPADKIDKNDLFDNKILAIMLYANQNLTKNTYYQISPTRHSQSLNTVFFLKSKISHCLEKWKRASFVGICMICFSGWHHSIYLLT
jgi:hypothetical protein